MAAAAPEPEPLSPRERRAVSFAHALGFDLVRAQPSGWALCERDGTGRIPNSGGCDFEEVVKILRRRNLGEW